MVYCSLQKTSSQTVPDRKWTTVNGYDRESMDTLGMHRKGSAEIVIPESGVYLFSAKVNFSGGGKVSQRLIRFIREDGDSTGAIDFVPTVGTDYKTQNWPCYMRKGRTMRLQVKNHGTDDCRVTGAQFKATRIA